MMMMVKNDSDAKSKNCDNDQTSGDPSGSPDDLRGQMWWLT